MTAIGKRLAALEQREGIGSSSLTVFINQFSGETTGARAIDGRTWARAPGETEDDFKKRLERIVPHPKGGLRLIALMSSSDDGTADFGLL